MLGTDHYFVYRGGGGGGTFSIKEIVRKLYFGEKIFCFNVMKEKNVCRANGHFFKYIDILKF